MDTTWIPKTLEILKNFYELNPFPYMAMGAWMLFSIWYVYKAFKDYANINRYLLQMIPFVFTALGLLGAVAASLGFIWGFTPDDLLSGSSALFRGLLGAATTAIVGIALSMIFGKLISMTHYKVEMRKALENNELFVLKKMLKLLLKSYAKEQHNVNLTLDSLKGVRKDVKDLGPDLDRNTVNLQEAVVGALKGENDAPVSRQITRLRQELLRHTDVLMKQSARQNDILERIADALDGQQEQSLARQLETLRDEQRSRNSVLETNLGSLYETLQKLDNKQIVDSVRIAVQDQTKAIAATLESSAKAREEQTQRQQETLEALHAALQGIQQAHAEHMQSLENVQHDIAREQQQVLENVSQTLQQGQSAMQQAHAARLDELEQLQRDSVQELVSSQQAHARVQQQALDSLQQTQEQTRETHSSRLDDLQRQQLDSFQELAREIEKLQEETSREFQQQQEEHTRQQQQTRDTMDSMRQAWESESREQNARLEELKQLQQETNEAVTDAREASTSAMQEVEQRTAKLLEDILARNRRQARELAALARQLDPDLQDALPLQLVQLQQQVQSLSESLGDSQDIVLDKLQQQQQLVDTTRSVLLEELLKQQASAASEAARVAAERFGSELAPRIRDAVDQLHNELDTLGRKQETIALETAQRTAEQSGDKIARQAAQDLRRHQAGQFGGLSRQLDEISSRMQKSFERIGELGSQTRDLSSDTAALKELLQRSLQAQSSLQNITSVLEKLSPADGNGNKGDHYEGLENAMQQLVQRLRQVDAIKKNDVKFWRQVERQMHDGIPIIMGGNKLNLNDDLNGNFQDRLQRSFSNLDRILKTIVSGYQSRAGNLQ